MKLNTLTNNMINSNAIAQSSQSSKIESDRLSEPPGRQLYSTSHNRTGENFESYNKQGYTYPMNIHEVSSISAVDKGTAIGTTVYINRQAFETIIQQSTYGDVKWEELGVDDEKRWVVINGQRFETEHSPEEKAQRKKNARMTLVDILNDLEKEKKAVKKGTDNGADQPRGNIESLQNNPVVMTLLGNIFNETTNESILSHLA